MIGLLISLYLKIYVKLKDEQGIYFNQRNKNCHQEQLGLQENVKILYGLNIEPYMQTQKIKIKLNFLLF